MGFPEPALVPEVLEARVHDGVVDRPEREVQTDAPGQAESRREGALPGEDFILGGTAPRKIELVVDLRRLASQLEREAAGEPDVCPG